MPNTTRKEWAIGSDKYRTLNRAAGPEDIGGWGLERWNQALGGGAGGWEGLAGESFYGTPELGRTGSFEDFLKFAGGNPEDITDATQMQQWLKGLQGKQAQRLQDQYFEGYKRRSGGDEKLAQLEMDAYHNKKKNPDNPSAWMTPWDKLGGETFEQYQQRLADWKGPSPEMVSEADRRHNEAQKALQDYKAGQTNPIGGLTAGTTGATPAAPASGGGQNDIMAQIMQALRGFFPQGQMQGGSMQGGMIRPDITGGRPDVPSTGGGVRPRIYSDPNAEPPWGYPQPWDYFGPQYHNTYGNRPGGYNPNMLLGDLMWEPGTMAPNQPVVPWGNPMNIGMNPYDRFQGLGPSQQTAPWLPDIWGQFTRPGWLEGYTDPGDGGGDEDGTGNGGGGGGEEQGTSINNVYGNIGGGASGMGGWNPNMYAGIMGDETDGGGGVGMGQQGNYNIGYAIDPYTAGIYRPMSQYFGAYWNAPQEAYTGSLSPMWSPLQQMGDMMAQGFALSKMGMTGLNPATSTAFNTLGQFAQSGYANPTIQAGNYLPDWLQNAMGGGAFEGGY